MIVQGDLKTYIADKGGALISKVTDECTHLIANQKQYNAKGVKGELMFLFCRIKLFQESRQRNLKISMLLTCTF